tara:strand:+ start:498 stop:734 length:237 start_codon:yes stop_codon:yes gene_type:complete
MEIEFNGKSYYITRNSFEPINQFEKRAWFIAKCHSNKQNKDSLDKIIQLSKIYTNIEFNKCKYNEDITSKINKLKQYL